MSRGARCVTCMYRTTDEAHKRSRPGCSYLLITGHSRLAEVYRRLQVNVLTDEVREAMRPENCRVYQRGEKIILQDEDQILLPGTLANHRRMDKTRAQELYERGFNDREIADKLGCACVTVRHWRQRQGLPHNYQHSAVPPEDIMKLYREGKTDKEICLGLGISSGSLSKWRKKRGLPPNLSQEKKDREVRLQLLKEGLSVQEIAERVGVSRSALHSWMKVRGLHVAGGQKETQDGSM